MSFVQQVSAQNGYPSNSSSFTSPSITFTAGNTIIAAIFVNGNSGGGITSVTDGLGNTYTHLAGSQAGEGNGSIYGGFGNYIELWYCSGCLGGATTVTAHTSSGTNTSNGICVLEYSNLGSPVSWARGNQATGSTAAGTHTITTNSITGSSDLTLIVFFYNDSGSGTVSYSYTQRDGFATQDAGVGEQHATSASGVTPGVTISVTANWSGVAIGFANVAPPAATSNVQVVMMT